MAYHAPHSAIEAPVHIIEPLVQSVEAHVDNVVISIEPFVDVVLEGVEPFVDLVLERIEPFVDRVELPIHEGLKQGQLLPKRSSFRRKIFNLSAKLLHLRRDHILNRLFQVLINV